MPKLNLSDVFKRGNDVKIKNVDFTVPSKVKELKAVIRSQEQISKRKDTDWQKLDSFKISL